MSVRNEEYIYAVARIRCKEGKLFSAKNIEQMIAMNDTESVERYLGENGWAINADENTDVIAGEEKALWKLMGELTGDLSAFDFLRVQKDFHNLKACIKASYSDCDPTPMFLQGGTTEPAEMYKNILDKNYSALPDHLSEVAQEAMTTLLQTADGQLCDAIIDRECLNKVFLTGLTSSHKIVREYCELFVAATNIRIAVRGSKLQKSSDFLLRLMAPCDSLDIKKLAVAASKGFDEICSYLLTTDYKSAVSVIKESLSAFEKWCDNLIMQKLRGEKNDPFSIAPLIGYVVAKETEIKAVRLILTAKANALDESVIRERIREMYV